MYYHIISLYNINRKNFSNLLLRRYLKMDFSNFEKCNVKPTIRNSGIYVELKKKHNAIILSAELVNAANFKCGDRVDLYKYKDTYAIKKASVGCLKLGVFSKTSKSLVIRNISAYLEVAPFVNGKTILNAWADNGIVFFTAKELD